MSRARRNDLADLYRALQAYGRLFQFRDPNNACLFDLRVNECYGLDFLVTEGPVSVSDLAAALGVHKSNASRIAKALQDAGLIEVVGDPSDGRSAVLRATEAGRAKQADVQTYLEARFKTALTSFPKADVEAAVRVLDALTEDAEDRLADQGP